MTTNTGVSDEPVRLKVIGLGLGRTGTLSLSVALEILGFGPCYHPVRLGVETNHWGKIAKAARDIDNVTPEILADIFGGYVSALDSTTAVLAKPLYETYPDAKFILTVRDTAKWVESMKKTVFKYYAQYTERQERIVSGTATEIDHILYEKTRDIGLLDWENLYHEHFHGGRLETDPEGEFRRHNQYITQLIPPENLLIFDVAEGWKPLAEFLGVPEPSEPFPHLNEPDYYKEVGQQWWEELLHQTQTQS